MKVEELLKSRNIEFKAKGNDFLIRCLNPEHDDSNPSMSIDRELGIFRCLSCGYKGNIYHHFGVYKNLVHSKALQMQKKIHNLYYPTFSIPLDASPFSINYRNIKASTYEDFDAFTHPDYPNRVVFPIYNSLDQIVCFHARRLYSHIKEKKYINQPAHVQLPLYPSYPKKIINNSIFLVEGLFDVLNLYDKGLQNAVCMFGLSLDTKDRKKQKDNLKRLEVYRLQGVDKIYLLLDNDENEAGNKAAENIHEYISKEIMSEVFYLPKGRDPGSLDETFVQRIKDAI